jgi:hypothetical protein
LFWRLPNCSAPAPTDFPCNASHICPFLSFPLTNTFINVRAFYLPASSLFSLSCILRTDENLHNVWIGPLLFQIIHTSNFMNISMFLQPAVQSLFPVSTFWTTELLYPLGFLAFPNVLSKVPMRAAMNALGGYSFLCPSLASSYT